MTAVLLLNATYEPLTTIGLHRAIVLVLQDKAEIVHSAEGEVRSATMAVPLPLVIRLKSYVKVPFRNSLPLSRRALMARDGGRCQYCGKDGDTIDHVLPRAKGGKHLWENVVLACSPCNQKKADKTLAQLGWKLPREPKAPKGNVWLSWGKKVHESWEPYLSKSST